jgi:hypothetical protein
MTLWDHRKQLWANDYRPVCIRSHPDPLKFPTLKAWPDLARRDPPYPAVTDPPDERFQNTGILADGLRPIDIDLNEADACFKVAAWCLDNLGPAPIRYRCNAPRVLLPYRAAEGSPHKVKAWDRNARQGVEVLGHGLQFMAYGTHASGAPIMWWEDSGPHNVHHDALTAITEDQVTELLSFAARFLPEPTITNNRRDGCQPAITVTDFDTDQWLDVDLEAVLDAIPNNRTDYDWWLRIGMAAFVASHGSATGYALFEAWSKRNGTGKQCADLWAALQRNPPHSVTGQTLIWHAKANDDFWCRPSRQLATLRLFSMETI